MLLQERLIPAPGAGRVDRATGRIQNVKVLGRESKNGRSYSDAALQQICRLAEGCPVNVDHTDPGTRRSYRDRIGRLENVRLTPAGVFGDLVVNTSHDLAEQLLDDAERSPRSVGMSIDAKGRSEMRGGKAVVTDVQSLRSVDVVADPATTNGLYESRLHGDSPALRPTSETLSAANRLDWRARHVARG
jgi:hypothetical protein